MPQNPKFKGYDKFAGYDTTGILKWNEKYNENKNKKIPKETDIFEGLSKSKKTKTKGKTTERPKRIRLRPHY
tara:strand:- start:51 stop:266 length:216 start_codon:yes stop_codon:yes gene_type:complete